MISDINKDNSENELASNEFFAGEWLFEKLNSKTGKILVKFEKEFEKVQKYANKKGVKIELEIYLNGQPHKLSPDSFSVCYSKVK